MFTTRDLRHFPSSRQCISIILRCTAFVSCLIFIKYLFHFTVVQRDSECPRFKEVTFGKIEYPWVLVVA